MAVLATFSLTVAMVLRERDAESQVHDPSLNPDNSTGSKPTVSSSSCQSEALKQESILTVLTLFSSWMLFQTLFLLCFFGSEEDLRS